MSDPVLHGEVVEEVPVAEMSLYGVNVNTLPRSHLLKIIEWKFRQASDRTRDGQLLAEQAKREVIELLKKYKGTR